MTININFDDKTKYDSPIAIRDATDAAGKDIFTKEEKATYFFDFAVVTAEDAREVAKLLLKVKGVEKLRKPDLELVKALESEKSSNSKAFQVVNKIFLVDEAILWLKELNRTDLPADNATREAKIKEYETEIGKIHAEQAPTERKILDLQKEKIIKLKEKESLKGAKDRWNSIVKVLEADKNSNVKITDINGKEIDLSDVTNTVTYKDYKAREADLWEKDDVAISTKSDTIKNAVTEVKSFLQEIVDSNGFAHKMSTSSVESDLEYYNGRKHNNKNNVTSGYKDFGYSYLKVLRDVGYDTLAEIIDNDVTPTGGTTKDELKKIAKEIITHIDRAEIISGSNENIERFEDSTTEWAKIQTIWNKKLLQQKRTEYPYVMVPDYKKIFLFMKQVFPANVTSGTPAKVSSLKPADYLDKFDHPRYIKPKSGAEGWGNLWINGINVNPRTEMARIGQAGKGLISYINENPGDTQIDSTLKYQLKTGAQKIADDTNFKTLTKIWWDIFASYMNDPNSVTDNEFVNNDVTYNEAATYEYQNQIRFCKAMKSILSDLKLLSQPDEFDSYLLQVSHAATLESLDKSDVYKNLQQQSIFKKFKAGEVWGDESKNYEQAIALLANLGSDANIRFLAAEDAVKGINQQIALLNDKNADDKNKITDYQNKIKFLKGLGEDEELPTEDKKTRFKEFYDKKDGRPEKKWHYSEIQRMNQLLVNIKKEIDSSEFDRDFKAKETELKGIMDKIKEINNDLYDNWTTIKNKGKKETGGLSPLETIAKILKEGADKGITLEKARDAHKALAEQILLEDVDKYCLEKIEDAILHPDNYRDKPSSDLTAAELKNLFHTATLSDADVKESEWKGVNNFNTKDKVQALIGNYYKGSGKPEEGALKEHITDTIKWADVSGDEYWEKLIKKGPEYVIGAIRQYEYHHGKGKYATQSEKDAVANAVKDANDDEKAKALNVVIQKKWETNNPQDMAKFIYFKEIGKTGVALIKESKAIETPEQDGGGNGKGNGKKWWQNPKHLGFWGLWGGLTVAAVGIVCVVVWWENIKNWWEPAEENTDQDKENE